MTPIRSPIVGRMGREFLPIPSMHSVPSSSSSAQALQYLAVLWSQACSCTATKQVSTGHALRHEDAPTQGQWSQRANYLAMVLAALRFYWSALKLAYAFRKDV